MPIKTNKPPKIRKITPENDVTRQISDLKHALIISLTNSFDEDPYSDFTTLLESEVLVYRRSLRKIGIRPGQQNPSNALNHSPKRHLTSQVDTATLVHSFSTLEPVIIRDQMQSYVRSLPDGLEWDKAFGMIDVGEVLWKLFGTKIIKLTGQVVVKIGTGQDNLLDEAVLMEFVKKETNIPLPEIYGFHIDGNRESFLFMSYVEGQTLESCWSELSSIEKAGIETQLARFLSELRAITPPAPLFLGSIATKTCRDARRMQRECQGIDSEQQFNEFIGRFTFRRESEHARRLLSLLKVDHQIVLTHGDFHPRNILIEDGQVTGIIDWELGGWYPEYWEFFKGAPDGKGLDGWWDHVKNIVGDYSFNWLIDLHLDPLIVKSPIG
jgi:aminoglycoside phosphotransferase